MVTSINSIIEGQKILKAKKYSLQQVSQPDASMTSYLWKFSDLYVVDMGIGEFYNDIVISSTDKSYVNTFIEQGLGQGFTLIDQGNLKEYKREWYKYKKGKYMLGISNINGTYKVSLSFDK